MAWVTPAISRLGRRSRDLTAGKVETVCAALEELNRSTERDFLAVGSRLMDLRTNSRELAEMSQSIAACISGSTGDRLLASLENLVVAAGTMEKSSGRAAALGQVVAACDEFHRSLARMEQSIMKFHVLGMLTRVETARVDRGSGDFQNLAIQVRSMSGEIGQQVAGMASAGESLGALLADGHRTVVQCEDREMRLLRSAAERLVEDAEAFRARRRSATETSARVVANYREITGAIEQLATGIQFHDITHQQIEHIVATLRTSAAGARAALRGVAGLQGAQLRATRTSFLDSVESIRKSLARIREQVREISVESAELLKNARAEGESFFAALEAQGREASRALAGYRSAEDKIREVASSSRRTIADAAGRVGELESIGVAVERLALNAGIRATHLQRAGEPLSVLAAAVKTLACETADESSEMARLLATMQTSIGSFEQQITQGASPAMAEDLDRAISEMQEAMGFTSAQLERIGRQAEQFSAELEAAGSAFSVDDGFRQVVEKAIGDLEELQEGATVTEREAMEKAAGRYTMLSERLVHDGFGTAGPAVGEIGPPGASDPLGDNVELF
jgi:methyl-accepting chemotaxis protein